MDSNLQSSPADSGGAKAAFRKPSNDVLNRKYRRRSPANGSSSSDGSPNRDRSSSPIPHKEDPARWKDDRRDLDRAYGRSQCGRTVDSYRHSDRCSSRNHKHDDYKSEKHVYEDEGKESNLSSHFVRESRAGKYVRANTDGSGHRSRDRERQTSPSEYRKYKDTDSSSSRAGSGRRQTYSNSEEVNFGERNKHKGTENGQDGKEDYRRDVGDHNSDLSPAYEECRGYRRDSASRRPSSGHRLKEASRSDSKELDCQKYPIETKKKYDNWDPERRKERHTREMAEKSEDRTNSTSEDQEYPAKKPKLFSLERSEDHGKNVSKFTTAADERQPSDSQKTSNQEPLKDSDIDAAKVAAIKAAELVNRNLVGTGYMSADQKKKLLWGNKKNTNTVEESTHRWDTSLFSDRERQEKFNKLMGVKGGPKVENKPDTQDASGGIQDEKQNQLQLDLEKQYAAGLRRRDGRTVGLGL